MRTGCISVSYCGRKSCRPGGGRSPALRALENEKVLLSISSESSPAEVATIAIWRAARATTTPGHACPGTHRPLPRVRPPGSPARDGIGRPTAHGRQAAPVGRSRRCSAATVPRPGAGSPCRHRSADGGSAQSSAPPPVPARPADAGQASSRIEIADGDPRRHALARAVPRCRRTAVSRPWPGSTRRPATSTAARIRSTTPGAATAWTFRPARWRRARTTNVAPGLRRSLGPRCGGRYPRSGPSRSPAGDRCASTGSLASRTRNSRPYGSHRTVAEHPQCRRRVAESRRAAR